MTRASRHTLAILRPTTRSRGGRLAGVIARYRRSPKMDRLQDLAEHGLLRHVATLPLWPGSVGPLGDLTEGFRRGLPPGLRPGDVLVHLESLSVHVVDALDAPLCNLQHGLNMVLGIGLTRDITRHSLPIGFTANDPVALAAAIAPALAEAPIAVRARFTRDNAWTLTAAELGRVLVAILDATPERLHPGVEHPLLRHLFIHHPPRLRRYA